MYWIFGLFDGSDSRCHHLCWMGVAYLWFDCESFVGTRLCTLQWKKKQNSLLFICRLRVQGDFGLTRCIDGGKCVCVWVTVTYTINELLLGLCWSHRWSFFHGRLFVLLACSCSASLSWCVFLFWSSTKEKCLVRHTQLIWKYVWQKSYKQPRYTKQYFVDNCFNSVED